MGKIDTKVKDRFILEEIGEKLLAGIVAATEAPGDVLSSEGMIVVPVKYADGSFKNKTIGAKWDFYAQYVYVGARGDLIFGLNTPDQEREADKPLWETAEFTCKKLDDAFPLLLPELMRQLGIDRKLNLMSELVDHLYAKRSVENAMEMETAEEKLQANPLFGLF